MSKYTVTIRQLVETKFDLGLKDYPIFNENYREILNKKIIDHYYFREIGFETAGRFKFEINRKMNEIMIYYNQLYKSEMYSFSPISNINVTNNYTSTDSRVSNSEDVSTNEGLNVDSTTPQSLINYDNIENNLYANNAEKINSESTNKNKSDSTNRINNYNKDEGYSGISGSELLNQYRSTFLNIDLEIINDLGDLFMNIY